MSYIRYICSIVHLNTIYSLSRFDLGYIILGWYNGFVMERDSHNTVFYGQNTAILYMLMMIVSLSGYVSMFM